MSEDNSTKTKAEQEQSTLDDKLKSTDATSGLGLDPNSPSEKAIYNSMHHIIREVSSKMNNNIGQLEETISNQLDASEKRIIAEVTAKLSAEISAHFDALDKKLTALASVNAASKPFSYGSFPSKSQSSALSTNRSTDRPSGSKYTVNRDRSRSPHPVRSQHSNRVVRCSFCNSDKHKSRFCDAALSAAERQSIMRSRNECSKCFNKITPTHPRGCGPRDCERGCTYDDGVPKRHMDFMCPRNPALTE